MKKNFLVSSLTSLVVILSVISVGAQITFEEKIYVPEPLKIEIPTCDLKRMIKKLSFNAVKKSTSKKDYYDLRSDIHRDDRYQEFTVELTNCKIESGEKKEYVSEFFSYVIYNFALASFPFDIDMGRSNDGLRKILSIWVMVKLEVNSLQLSTERKEFFDGILRHPERPISIKGRMRYLVYGNEIDKSSRLSIGEISQLIVIINPGE